MKAIAVVFLVGGLAGAVVVGARLAERTEAPRPPASVALRRTAFPRGDPEKLRSRLARAEVDLHFTRHVPESSRSAWNAGLDADIRAVAEGRPVILTAGMPGEDYPGIDPETDLWYAHMGCQITAKSVAYASAHNAAVIVALLGGDPRAEVR